MDTLKSPTQVAAIVEKHDRLNLRFGISVAAVICWILFGFAILNFVNEEFDEAVLIHRTADEHQQHELVATRTLYCALALALMAICSSINFKLAAIRSALKDAHSVTPKDAKSEQLLSTIAAELKWQREQKEKEIHRDKAAASSKK